MTQLICNLCEEMDKKHNYCAVCQNYFCSECAVIKYNQCEICRDEMTWTVKTNSSNEHGPFYPDHIKQEETAPFSYGFDGLIYSSKTGIMMKTITGPVALDHICPFRSACQSCIYKYYGLRA